MVKYKDASEEKSNLMPLNTLFLRRPVVVGRTSTSDQAETLLSPKQVPDTTFPALMTIGAN